MDDEVRKDFEARMTGDAMIRSPGKKNQRKDWLEHMSGLPSQKCRLQHKHTRRCYKMSETDIATLQTKAFKYMMLQKPIDEPTGFDLNRRCRASFFPKARLPAELLE